MDDIEKVLNGIEAIEDEPEPTKEVDEWDAIEEEIMGGMEMPKMDEKSSIKSKICKECKKKYTPPYNNKRLQNLSKTCPKCVDRLNAKVAKKQQELIDDYNI